MIAQRPRIGVVSEAAQECRRTLNVSEEKGKRLNEEMLGDCFRYRRLVPFPDDFLAET